MSRQAEQEPDEPAVKSSRVKTTVDPRAGESTHIIFGFRRARETPPAGELKIVPVSEIDMALPGPRVVIPVFSYDGDVSLITM